MLLFGGLLLALIVGAALLIASAARNPTAGAQQLSARLAALEAITTQGERYATNAKLREINANAALLIANDILAVDSALAAEGVKSPTPATIALEADSKGLANLESERINGRFDAAYVTLLSSHLQSSRTLLKTVYARASTTQLRDATNKTYKDFGDLADQLSKVAL